MYPCQHKQHPFHVNGNLLNREIYQDYSIDGIDNMNHQHREIGLHLRIIHCINQERVFYLPMATSGIATIVVSVATRNGPGTDIPQP